MRTVSTFVRSSRGSPSSMRMSASFPSSMLPTHPAYLLLPDSDVAVRLYEAGHHYLAGGVDDLGTIGHLDPRTNLRYLPRHR